MGAKTDRLMCCWSTLLLIGTLVGFSVVWRFPSLLDALAWRLEHFQRSPTWSQRVYERRTLSDHMSRDALVPEGAVLFFGDSHLLALPVFMAEQGVSFAMGGETADRLDKRLAKYRSINAARAVVIGSGTNDLLNGAAPEDVEKSWDSILKQVRGRRVICVEIPVNSMNGSSADKYRKSNALIAERCRSWGHASISVEPGVGEFTQAGFASDGIHLDTRGSHLLMASIISRLDQMSK